MVLFVSVGLSWPYSTDGTMFTGSEFKVYCDSLAIEHITTPTYNPRSNGQTERFVETFK